MSIRMALCPLALILIGCHHLPLATPGAPAPDPTSLAEFMAEARKCSRVVTPSQQLGCILPEFGGAHIDSTGVLNVFVTDLRSVPRAQRIVHYQLELQKRPQLPVRFVRGDYSFQQMNAIIEKLTPYLRVGVAGIGINEWVNRIEIIFVAEEGRLRLEEAIRKLGLPGKAIMLQKGEYPKVL